MTQLLAVDASLFLLINGWQGLPALDSLLLWGTELGTAWFGALPVAILFVLRNRSPIRARLRTLLLATALGVLVGLLNTGLKMMVARERPSSLPNAKVLGPMLSLNSFPSGHAMLAFFVLAILWRLDRPLGWVWLPCALLVAFSRVYLGVHYPSDVVVGAALGFAPAYLLVGQYRDRF